MLTPLPAYSQYDPDSSLYRDSYVEDAPQPGAIAAAGALRAKAGDAKRNNKRRFLIAAPKYIGLDVHQATISAAVLDSTGKLLMESIVETKAATILQGQLQRRKKPVAIRGLNDQAGEEMLVGSRWRAGLRRLKQAARSVRSCFPRTVWIRTEFKRYDPPRGAEMQHYE
jgi:hypothetical protein